MNVIKKGGNWKAYLIIGIILLLLAAVYFTFFFYYKCDDLACFQAHQKECSKTKFVKDSEDTVWKYTIEGKEQGKCLINVETIMIKKGAIENQKLEGKSMDCLLPLASLSSPESDIERCHGELKEEMQNMIIQKLHSYIIENVEEIDEELEKLL